MNIIFGKKLGMGHFFTVNGKTFATTILKIGPCFIIKKNFTKFDGYNSIQVGYGFCFLNRLNNAQRGYFTSKNLIPFLFLQEFFVSNPDNFRIGQSLDTLIFQSQNKISLKSKRIGKGFCGVRKRYHFHKGPKTHGSKNYRQPGSIGQGTTPGRVFKGKKLAGNMGSTYKITKNLSILKIDYTENLLWVKGNIAGSKNALLVNLITN